MTPPRVTALKYHSYAATNFLGAEVFTAIQKQKIVAEVSRYYAVFDSDYMDPIRAGIMDRVNHATEPELPDDGAL